jgi:rubrerythrin
VSSDEANLLDGMAGEHYENTKMYVEFANQADAVGDKKVADLFRQIAADEGDHYAAYKAAVEKLRAEK